MSIKLGSYSISGKALGAIVVSIVGWTLAHSAAIQQCASNLDLGASSLQIVSWLLGAAGLVAASQTESLVVKKAPTTHPTPTPPPPTAP